MKPPGLRSLGSFNFEQVYFDEMRAFIEESGKRREWVNVSDVETTYDGRSWVQDRAALGE
jgi:hypothetical protein